MTAARPAAGLAGRGARARRAGGLGGGARRGRAAGGPADVRVPAAAVLAAARPDRGGAERGAGLSAVGPSAAGRGGGAGRGRGASCSPGGCRCGHIRGWPITRWPGRCCCPGTAFVELARVGRRRGRVRPGRGADPGGAAGAARRAARCRSRSWSAARTRPAAGGRACTPGPRTRARRDRGPGTPAGCWPRPRRPRRGRRP